MVIAIAIVFLVIDMLGRVEYLKAKAPWIDPLLERRATFAGLLVFAICLEAGTGYELLIKEVPPIPEGPKVTVNAPAPPTVQFIEEESGRTRTQSPSRPSATPKSEGAASAPLGIPPQQNPPPPQLEQRIAYEEVKEALQQVGNLDSEWTMGISDAEKSLRGRKYEIPGKHHTAQEILNTRAMFEQDIAVLNDRVKTSWRTISQQAQIASDDAIKRMRSPGPNQITPNEAEEKSQKFKDAMGAAQREPGLVDLSTDQIDDRERFEPMENYLRDLLKEIGNYQDNPKRQ